MVKLAPAPTKTEAPSPSPCPAPGDKTKATTGAAGPILKPRRSKRPMDRVKMRPWLVERLAQGDLGAALSWREEGASFAVRWPHAARQGYQSAEDAKLYRAWALHTGIFQEGDVEDHKKWKSNFRCALHSVKDIEEVTSSDDKKCRDPCRVYRLLQVSEEKNKKAKGDNHPLKPFVVKGELKKEAEEELRVEELKLEEVNCHGDDVPFLMTLPLNQPNCENLGYSDSISVLQPKLCSGGTFKVMRTAPPSSSSFSLRDVTSITMGPIARPTTLSLDLGPAASTGRPTEASADTGYHNHQDTGYHDHQDTSSASSSSGLGGGGSGAWENHPLPTSTPTPILTSIPTSTSTPIRPETLQLLFSSLENRRHAQMEREEEEGHMDDDDGMRPVGIVTRWRHPSRDSGIVSSPEIVHEDDLLEALGEDCSLEERDEGIVMDMTVGQEICIHDTDGTCEFVTCLPITPEGVTPVAVDRVDTIDIEDIRLWEKMEEEDN